MVNEEVLRNTIQKMREAGLSEQIIASTLTDLGLNAAQAQSYLGGRIVASPPTVSLPPNPLDGDSDLDHEVLATRTSEKIVQRLDERQAFQQDEQNMKDSITHLALEQHGQQLQDTRQAVVELHDKFDSANWDSMSNRLSGFNARLDQIAKDASETRALLSAVQSLMQKILETNQQLVFESKTKKL